VRDRAFPALLGHRTAKIQSLRLHAVNICRHRLNLLRIHWSTKHGPEFGKPIHHLPLIPANVLKNITFASRSIPVPVRRRLLQALWREDRDLPIGSYVNEGGKRRKLGSASRNRQAGEAAISSRP